MPKKERIESDVVGERLNQRQEKFCQLYTSDDREFFGNGVQSYLEVYNVDRTKPHWYDTAAVCASRLLRNAKIYRRIEQLLDEGGLNNVHVDKNLLFLITQQSDFAAKLGAIKEYNKLKARITDKKDITSGGKPITVKQVIYGDSNPVPVPAESVPDSVPESSSGGEEETGVDSPSSKRKG